MLSMRPDPEIRVQKVTIPADRRRIPELVLSPKEPHMLDDRETETSRDNHGKVWNTRRNHFGWRCYLRGQKRDGLSPYAAPARLTDFSGLPPAYTFVGDGEPFYAETVQYVENLKKSGIPASVDVYHSDMHAFDMIQPDTPLSQEAARRFNEQFAYAQAYYFAAQR